MSKSLKSKSKQSRRGRGKGRSRGQERLGYGVRMAVHRFKRCFFFGTQSYTTTSFAVEPSLSLSDGYTELTALFDQYRITKFDVTVIPFQTEGAAAPGTASVVPGLFAVVDQDGTGPTAITDFLQRGVVPTSLTRTQVFTCVNPSVADEVYGGGITTAYTPSRSPWIDAAKADVPHYGMYFLFNGTPVNGWAANVFVTLYIETREAR